MTDISQVRAEMEALSQKFQDDSSALRDPNTAFLQVSRWYGEAQAAKRELANEVLSEWIVGAELVKHDLAVMLVRQFQLASLVPALATRARSLKTKPGSEYDQRLLKDLIDELEP